jgi:hypothetical protein
MSIDPTENIRRNLIDSGQPHADLAAEAAVCRHCAVPIEHREGSFGLTWYHTDTTHHQCAGTNDHPTFAEPAPTWDTKALQAEFQVIGFAAPFVVVRRRSDGVKGTLEFTHQPRTYFSFQAD